MKRIMMICGIVGCMSNIYAMNERSNQQLDYTFKDTAVFPHPGTEFVTISPDNSIILSVSAYDKSVVFQERRTNMNSVIKRSYNSYVKKAVFSPDSSMAAIAMDGSSDINRGFAILDIEKGVEDIRYLNDMHCYGLAFTPDNQTVVAFNRKMIRMVNLGAQQVVREIEYDQPITACFIKEAMLLAILQNGIAKRMNLSAYSNDESDIKTDSFVRINSGRFGDTVALAANTIAIINTDEFHCSGDSIKIHDVQSGRTIATFDSSNVLKESTSIDSMALSENGKQLALHEVGGNLIILDTENSKVGDHRDLGMPFGTEVISSLTFSPDGRCVLVVSSPGKAAIFDAQTGKKIFTFNTEQVRTGLFSPDGSMAVVAGRDYNGTVMIAERFACEDDLELSSFQDIDINDEQDGRAHDPSVCMIQ